jgi:chemotaxis protein CheD
MNAATGSAAARDRHGARIERLRSAPRASGEASFFFRDAAFDAVAVKVLPGEYYVSNEDLLILTTLGSCIAVCLWDRHARIGGLNHFMLPEGEDCNGGSGRYGAYAMELLINAMLKRGAARSALEAKVFGGARIIGGASSLNVGQRNTEFALDYLAAERIAVLSKDVQDTCARKVCFLPATGKAMLKRLAPAQPEALAASEQRLAQPSKPAGGTIDLF